MSGVTVDIENKYLSKEFKLYIKLGLFIYLHLFLYLFGDARRAKKTQVD